MPKGFILGHETMGIVKSFPCGNSPKQHGHGLRYLLLLHLHPYLD